MDRLRPRLIFIACAIAATLIGGTIGFMLIENDYDRRLDRAAPSRERIAVRRYATVEEPLLASHTPSLIEPQPTQTLKFAAHLRICCPASREPP